MRTFREPVLFPRAYGSYVLLAALDVLLTWTILCMGGEELNGIAAWVIEHGGPKGITFYKFCTVGFVLVACELVGRRKQMAGKSLSRAAVAISVLPVGVALGQLAAWG
ncbi:MAG: hypothetical protein KDA20_02640 [Phycisphaerales bacterium]|nr:hypothetical protein [Phycisphaerales bacterium]